VTAPKPAEYLIAASLLTRDPVVGDYYLSPSGGSILAVGRVRSVRGERRGPAWRLIGMRVKRSELGADAVILPWPRDRKPQPRAEVLGPPTAPTAIVTLAAKATAERKRVLGIKRQHNDPHRTVEPIRLANQTLESGDWRDPDDVSLVRRVPKMVHGYRAPDPIDRLVASDTITRKQAHAARRFRRLFELGEIGLRGARDLSAPPSGYSSGSPPSEKRVEALIAYQAAAASLGKRLLGVVLAIVIRGDTIQKYAADAGRSRSAASGFVVACFERLTDHFEVVDGQER
jgi:hypothetical protein